jgi:GNAT superfamily N-acetyltransferase
MNNSIEIVSGSKTETAEIASVVTKAMLPNPIHLAIFDSADEKAETMQNRMFNTVLKLPDCNLFVAKQNGRIVGVMNYYKKGCCQISPVKTLSLLPGLAFTLKGKLPRVLKWKSNWGSHDPKAGHFHFGPLAVHPSMQGKGVGSSLLTHFCALADAEGIGSWLETDKEQNLPLYQKFGFAVREEDTLFGVKNWFMWRDAQKK